MNVLNASTHSRFSRGSRKPLFEECESREVSFSN
jgi:hypothetical protein